MTLVAQYQPLTVSPISIVLFFAHLITLPWHAITLSLFEGFISSSATALKLSCGHPQFQEFLNHSAGIFSPSLNKNRSYREQDHKTMHCSLAMEPVPINIFITSGHIKF